MNSKKERIIDELKTHGYSLCPSGISGPERDRYMLFSRAEERYLVSFHDDPNYKPNQNTFRRELVDAKNDRLHPLPIFDMAIFFKPDLRRSRATQGERRELLGLELITEKMFGEVTYASRSGLIVVSYGPVVADYTFAEVKGGGRIPEDQQRRILDTIKLVKQKPFYSHFELISLRGLGKIQVPEVRALQEDIFSISRESPSNSIRGRQLLDSTDSEDPNDFTSAEWQDVKVAIANDRT